MSDKLANGSFKGKKIKTISLTRRQQALRVNLEDLGSMLIERTIGGFSIRLDPSLTTRVMAETHECRTRIELTRPE